MFLDCTFSNGFQFPWRARPGIPSQCVLLHLEMCQRWGNVCYLSRMHLPALYGVCVAMGLVWLSPKGVTVHGHERNGAAVWMAGGRQSQGPFEYIYRL